MANSVTLTNLAPEIYKAMDTVSREIVGAIPGAMLNTADSNGVNAASFGDKVKSMRTPKTTPTSSFTPAMTPSDATDKNATFDEFALDQIAKDDLPLLGETVRRLNQAGGQAETFRTDTFAQIMRGVVNQMEGYLAGVLYKGASRAVGTAGTAPFASNLTVLTAAKKALLDNGAPQDNQYSFVMDTTAGMNFRNLTNLQKVNEAGTADLLRNGSLMNTLGFFLRESAGIASHTKGTGTLYDANGAVAVGDTTITLDGGTVGATGITAGDVVTFAGDDNNYVVGTGLAAGGGDIVLNRPGAQEIVADTTELTIGDSFAANVAFHRSAVEFAARSADMGQDAAVEVLDVIDPVSGIPFQFRRYAGEGMSKIMVVIYYGAKVWKSENVVLAMG